jgi:hypothetical protein
MGELTNPPTTAMTSAIAKGVAVADALVADRGSDGATTPGTVGQ